MGNMRSWGLMMKVMNLSIGVLRTFHGLPQVYGDQKVQQLWRYRFYGHWINRIQWLKLFGTGRYHIDLGQWVVPQ
uniref:Uncharacterized protein n=1 Tax=Leersia perrieri TaxID=77586 RepID=A0A0D9XY57_9ORYZ